jgi:methionine-gamma-lyase
MSKPRWNIQTQIVKSAEGKDFSKVRTPGIPIFQSSNYLYDDVESGTDIQISKADGYIYSRYSNPTVDALLELVSALEGSEDSLAFASGMAAISSTVLAFCRPGDHIVSSAFIYGGTYTFFQKQLERLNIEVTFVDPRDLSAVEAAIRPETKLLYTEPLANPTLIASDINAWGEIAKKHNCSLAVDNTFTPPPIFRPLENGTDISIHSATKYLGGHADLLGGLVCGNREIIETIRPVMKTYGPTMAPFVAWLLVRGIRTLGVRLERQNQTTAKLAEYLDKHDKVSQVFYAGLASNPQIELNRRQFDGYSGMLSFEVAGGTEEAKKVMQAFKLIAFTVSLGDISTLVSHPASASHVYLSPEERARININDGLLRLSVGLEFPEDIIADLEQALEKI